MIIVLKQNISESSKNEIKKFVTSKGYQIREIVGEDETVLGAVGSGSLDIREVELFEDVQKVIPISKPYKLASRQLKMADTIVKVKNVKIGGKRIVVIAGPCAIESREQIMSIASEVREAGAVMLRGGAFKPRTSPYSFQGLKEEGLKYLKEAGEKYEMPVTSEIVNPKDVEMMSHYIDMYQIGARNMQNFELLKAVGKQGMPVLLKRGMCATIEEWLMAAEYLMASGTDQVVLCERGIRTFETATRNTLDCSAIPVVQKMTHLPVIGDPSHATGMRDMVAPMSLALVSSGASGLIIEVHNNPKQALSDGPQSLYPSQFEKLMRDVEVLSPVVNKSLEKTPRILQPSLFKKEKVENSLKTIAYQGERGAYSELAVRRIFDESFGVLTCKTFSDVFDSILNGKAKYGVVPVENTLGGTIYDNVDLLLKNPEITVVGEQQVRIVHNLIGFEGSTLDRIKKVYSHPQGLSQCSEFLKNKLPLAEALPFFDTAGSVSYIKKLKDKSIAAIAGLPAAEYNGMSVLEEGIESNPLNYTRFYVICLNSDAEVWRSTSSLNKAALTFSVEDRPGCLYSSLEIFTKNEINMKKIESRPVPGKPWSYRFFIEVTFPKIENLKKIEKEMNESTHGYRVLGSFTQTV